MPSIRSLASKCCAYIMAVILLLGKIIPSCSCCEEKKLVYIIIIAPFSHQFFFCVKYTKLNMRLSCNVKSVSNTKYLYLMHSYSL